MSADIGQANTVTTLCTCWKLTRKDGTVMGFTDFSRPLTIDGVTYAAKTGYASTAIASSNGLAVDNLDIDGALSSDAITEEDITAGKYDFATIKIFQVNYMDLTATPNILRVGFLGNISRGDHAFTAEIRGIAQLAQRNIGELYSDTCRAALGDMRCGIDLTDYTFSATVTAVGDETFTIELASSVDKNAGYFKKGLVTFTSGNNDGVSMEVQTHTKDSTNDVITPFLPCTETIAVGDTLAIVAGCTGKLSVCLGTFDNYLNFRGEPDIPGTDSIYSYV
jgi:uncharacterized phage protein (TIGR02218 family)